MFKQETFCISQDLVHIFNIQKLDLGDIETPVISISEFFSLSLIVTIIIFFLS